MATADSELHPNSQTVLTGGTAIAIALTAIGFATNPLITITGSAMAGAVLAVVALFEWAANAD
ncbi:MAG: hypothetical protein ACOCQY_02695 [Halorhabdus sp.]